jgi:L-lactate dehydrogenase
MFTERGKGKVGLVGTGMVGASFAYSLVQSGLASELVLIDRDEQRAQGEAMDLNHGLAFVRPMLVGAGGYEQLAGCDVVVVCAGANQRPGETRLDLLQKNAAVFEDVIPKVVAACPHGVIVIATNPVDILTEISARLAGWPHGRVIGSGTLLDTARLRYSLGEYFDIDPRSVHAWTVAEHGDTLVAAWSTASVGGVPVLDHVGPSGRRLGRAQMDELLERTRRAGYEVIQRKQSTYYAIGLALLRIVEAVLRDQRTVMTVSTPLEGRFGIDGMSLSLPSVVGRHGVEAVLGLPMDEHELAAFQASGQALKRRLADMGAPPPG